ncbi:MAG: energy transducer TonB [Oligoflexia bacterium]|nr:energy transducer TonB [Oligoflexia bacterium]
MTNCHISQKRFVLTSLSLHFVGLLAVYALSSASSTLFLTFSSPKVTYISFPSEISKPTNRPAITTSNTKKNVPLVKQSATSGESMAKPVTREEASTATNTGQKIAASQLAIYLEGLYSAIDHQKNYPLLSRRLGETGKVIISIVLLKNGELENIQIKTKSAFSRLDQAALDTVLKIKNYKPIPESIASDLLTIDIPIEFTL